MNNSKTMHDRVQVYLAERRKLGFVLRGEGCFLRQFAHYADLRRHQGPITLELALEWAAQRKDSQPLSWARRLEIVRCFSKHEAIYDSRTQVPPRNIFGPAHRRPQPYVYSNDEIRGLIRTASALSPHHGLRPRTYVTLLGLLACTGLRISEALNLTNNDVDLVQGILTIREGKFHKSRLVPLHSSATLVLRRYARFRNRYLPHPESQAFFLSESGQPLPYSTVRTTFQILCLRLGWDPQPDGRRPRIHDLRHTFVCKRILQWYQHGADVDHLISALSVYLGHAKVTDTFWYLTGTPELLAVASQRFQASSQIPRKARR